MSLCRSVPGFVFVVCIHRFQLLSVLAEHYRFEKFQPVN